MTDFATVYFPSVSPLHSSLIALLMLHDKVWSYAPSENSVIADDLQWYCQEDMLKKHTPSPLGADQERFDRIIQDCWDHGEDILGASRFALSGKEDVEPGWDIVSSLTGEKRVSEQDKKLWQARILLGLQEKLDQQEREIDKNLALLVAQQSSLVDALRLGGDDQLKPVGHERPSSHTPQRDKQLLRAWARLFVVSDYVVKPATFATDQAGIASLLLTEYEKIADESPQKLFELSLPNIAFFDVESVREKVNLFHHKASQSIEELRKACIAHVDSEASLPELSEHIQAWQNATQECFETIGETRLEVYRFSGISLETLLARYARVETEQPKNGNMSDGILISIM